MTSSEEHKPSVDPLKTGLALRCPYCGKGALFDGLLKVTQRCNTCGFDLAKSDPGDGPAFLVITKLSFILVGLAVWLELAYEPPFWWHVALWVPAVIIFTPLLLRLTKSLLISYQYHFNIGFNKNNQELSDHES